jgi:hypothetical protein
MDAPHPSNTSFTSSSYGVVQGACKARARVRRDRSRMPITPNLTKGQTVRAKAFLVCGVLAVSAAGCGVRREGRRDRGYGRRPNGGRRL